MSVLLGLGVALVVMLQQHVSFMDFARQQSFLTSEAPQAGNLLGRLFGSADHYFVYESRPAALAGAAPVLVNGRAVRLYFEESTGGTREHWIAAETVGTATELRCYSTGLDGTEFSWTVCRGLAGATFRCDEGILGVTLQGPRGEEISYYGGAR